MSVKVMGHVWDLKLPANKKFVLLAYADHADHDGLNIYPATDSIAAKTGYSRRQVQRITDQLIADGYLIEDGTSNLGTNKFKFGWKVGVKLEDKKNVNKGRQIDTPKDDKLTPQGVTSCPKNDVKMSPEPSLEPSIAAVSPTPQHQQVVDAWKECSGSEMAPTPNDLHGIYAAEKQYSHAWIMDAIREAKPNAPRTWSYVRRILDRWEEQGKPGSTSRVKYITEAMNPTEAQRLAILYGTYTGTNQ